MFKHTAAACVALLFMFVSASFAFANDWKTYVNAESGFSVDYPVSLFTTVEPSQEGNGIALKSSDGKIEFRAYSFNNGDELPLSQIRDIIVADLEGREVTYQRSKKNWIVLSGYESGGGSERDIFYQRLQASADTSRFSAFEIIYPETERAIVDKLIKRMSLSLTAPENL